MKLTIDTDKQTLTTEEGELPLYSEEAFKLVSTLWLQLGWNARYHYTFTWMGRPILQLPEDILRLQEVLWELQPDIIIETGSAFGGSLLFYASLCVLTGKGHVIGVEIDLHPTNREALVRHNLRSFITPIEGDSTDPKTFKKVTKLIDPEYTVCVILDANHSKEHVLKELNLYAPLVTPGSYIIVADGFKQSLTGVPRGKKEWAEDNPATAVHEFLATHPEFVLEYPEKRYNRSDMREPVTHFQNGWLRKKDGNSKRRISAPS